MENDTANRPTFRKSPPEGVVEIVGIGRDWSMVQLTDGTLLAACKNRYRISHDKGASWENEQELPEPVNVNGLLRLQSGALAASSVASGSGREYRENMLWLSYDEGQSWNEGRPISMLGAPYCDTLIQLSGGRLLYPNRICFENQNHPDVPLDHVRSYGIWKGLRRQVDGHYHWPEIDIASVSYSDDEGSTWQICDGQLMGWFDHDGVPNGYAGITACDEPSVVETADDRVLFLARSTVGRLVSSYSEDHGTTWSAIRPTVLASSYSPPAVTTIPNTGDLLCVWNQVSRDEIRRGYRRGRLSAALSRDSGATWEQFRTIEVSVGIEDVERIAPEHPISPVNAEPNLGQIPNDFAVFRYPNIHVIGDRVYILYSREWFELSGGKKSGFEDEKSNEVTTGSEEVLRSYPLTYFYP